MKNKLLIIMAVGIGLPVLGVLFAKYQKAMMIKHYNEVIQQIRKCEIGGQGACVELIYILEPGRNENVSISKSENVNYLYDMVEDNYNESCFSDNLYVQCYMGGMYYEGNANKNGKKDNDMAIKYYEHGCKIKCIECCEALTDFPVAEQTADTAQHPAIK